MNRQIDLEISRAVRRVLVRHWIDLGLLSVRTINCVVRVTGTMQRLDETNRPLTVTSLNNLVEEVNQIRAIRRLRIELRNWSFESGIWRRLDEAAPGQKPMAYGR